MTHTNHLRQAVIGLDPSERLALLRSLHPRTQRDDHLTEVWRSIVLTIVDVALEEKDFDQWLDL